MVNLPNGLSPLILIIVTASNLEKLGKHLKMVVRHELFSFFFFLSIFVLDIKLFYYCTEYSIIFRLNIIDASGP